MKLLKIILLAFIVFMLSTGLSAQDNAATPEYEATKQTEKLQQELNLSTSQVKKVYEINLKYARARQSSVSRSEAMERMKNKDADLQNVLSNEQINRLQNKRYERSSFQTVKPGINFRSSGESTPSRTTTRTTSDEAVKSLTRRSNSEMQTNRNASNRNATNREGTNRNADVQPRRFTPQDNNQRSVAPSTRSTTPSPPQNTESKRVESSPTGSQRR
ncbi:MAG TPA: hypothetical protein P5084_06375 [Paludibacter sp.]|nr:hypothetical protein [Paludibacter sp.]